MTQVHPLTVNDGANDVAKSAGLRGAASLGGDAPGAPCLDASTNDTTMEWSQRSEFDLLLDFLDTDGNGKISALELADFVDSLLGTQDHKRPNGSIIFEAVLATSLRHAALDKEAAAAEAAMPRPGQRPPPPPLPPPPSSLPSKRDSGRWTSSGPEVPDAGAAVLSKQRTSGWQSHGSMLSQLGNLQSSVSMKEIQEYGASQFLSMSAVRNCFADLLADTEMWIRVSRSCSVMTTSLFRQLLMYSAGRLEKKFSMWVFLKTYAAFNALPLWLPFTRLWRTSRNGTLFVVYLHQLTKLQAQLGPRLASRLPLHATLLVLTMVQFIASYVPLIVYLAANGIPALGHATSVVGFVHSHPLKSHVSLFSSVLPWAVLQFLTSSAALKLSCRDFINLKEQCKAVFMLGDIQSEFDGYRGLTVREVMDTIKAQVALTCHTSGFRRVNASMPMIFGFSLETFRRLVRLFLAGNLVPQEPLGKVIVAFEVYALVYNIWFAYSESADCTEYLFKLRKVSSVFKTLLSKEEALSQSLPWLNNHSPRNLLLWSRLRRYYQSPNCLELRWIEMHLTLVVLAAIAVTVLLVVTFVQKTLLKFTPENADLQLFVVWVIPAFIYLLVALVIDVIMSASTGMEYHDGVMTLSAEAVFIADRLNSAREVVRRYGEIDDEEPPAVGKNPLALEASEDSDDDSSEDGGGGSSGGARQPTASTSAHPRAAASDSGLVRRVATGSGTGTGEERDSAQGGGGGRSRPPSGRRGSGALEDAAVGGGGGGGYGGGSGWAPALHYRLSRGDRARLRQCQQVIKSLVTYIQFNAEFITIFGVPIDTHLRNTLFSVSITLVGAGVSAFLAIVVKR